MRDQVYTPELITAAIGGDDSALSFLYNSTQAKVTQTVRSMIRDEDAVLDIVQDSFIKGFRSLDKLDSPQNYLAWMRRIATNTAVDYLKKKKPVLFSELASEDGMEIEFEDENIGHMPDVLLDQKETSRLIQEIVSGLSDEQQLAIGLFYFEDMPIKSIAEKLGCSENTVKSRLNYGRKNIEKQVLELEKKGTKLYSLAPVPFFLWLLRSMRTEPSRDILGTVLAECRRLASGASATASQAAVQVGSQVAKKAAAGAAKKLAVKIAAGILAAATVGGAAVAISNANEEPSTYRRPSHSETRDNETRDSEPTEEASTDPTEPDTTPTVPEVDPTPAYQVILDELKAASRHPYDDGPYYYFFHDGLDLYYCLYDIDKNGIDELLIGRPNSIAAIYTFDGEKAQCLVNRFCFGLQSRVDLMKTGEVYIEAVNTGCYSMQRLAEDGCSFATIFQYQEVLDETGYPWYEDAENGNRIDLMEFNQMMLNTYTPRKNLRWVQFTGTSMDAAQNYLPVLNEYIAACGDSNYLEHREQYPNTVNDGMYYYHSFGAFDISYALFDIDENGVDELLIGTPGDVWDVYAFDGTKPVKLVNIEALGGGRSTLTVMDSGELYIEGASGADDVAYYMLRIGADGVSTESVFYFTSKDYESYEGLDGSEYVALTEEEFKTKMRKYEDANIPWVSLSEIPTPRDEAYQVILEEYTDIVFAMDEGTYDPQQMPHAKPIYREKLDQWSDAEGFTLTYGYFDIDRNGTNELLIGYATSYGLYTDFMNITTLDVYTFDGKQAVQLFPEDTLGYTVKLHLVNEGEMYLEDDRQDGGSYVLAQIASDGYSLEVLYSYQTRLEDGEVIYYNDTESYSEFDFNWAFPPLYYDDDIEWTGFAMYSE